MTDLVELGSVTVGLSVAGGLEPAKTLWVRATAPAALRPTTVIAKAVVILVIFVCVFSIKPSVRL
jgi:hypothetical protein